MIKIKLYKGPIDDKMLEAIGRLYGNADKKYASIDFLRKKFNFNPHGYSLHAMAYDKENIIGHYSIIPVSIKLGDKELLSGKGEALYVHERYRKIKIEKALTIGLALVSKLNSFALQNGIEIFYDIVSDNLKFFYRKIEFERVVVPSKINFHFTNIFLRYPFKSNKLKFVTLVIISGIQSCFYYLLKSSFFLINKVNFEPKRKSDQDFIVNVLPTLTKNYFCDKNKWSVKVDEKSLLWYLHCGLEIITKGQSSDDYIIVSNNHNPGDTLEIIDWNLTSKSLVIHMKALLYIIQKAKKQRASMVVFFDLVLSKNQRGLKIASFLLGFLKRKHSFNIFIKSKDKFFLDKDNIYYNPYFHTTF